MIRKYEIMDTEDGSHTLKIPGTDITFHSKRGAIQESVHVFIQSGLQYFLHRNPLEGTVRIFEAGLGSGLNALLTAIAARDNGKQVAYSAVDLYPLPDDIISRLNYPQILNEADLYREIMQAGWGQWLSVASFFRLRKIRASLVDYVFNEPYHIIYFDAFAPEDQEDMWSDAIFSKLFNAIVAGGVLVTYCSKSIVRKALQQAGFKVEKIPGPPGKREIVRAVKP